MSCCKTVETIKGLWSLIVGLKVTGKNYVKPQITVHYPRQTAENVETFNGHIVLVGKPKEPAVPKCISCMLCATNCPSKCIVVKKPPKPKPVEVPEGEEAPPAPKPSKTPVKWTVDYNLCSLCGTCAEVCPVKSIAYSTDVYLAGYERSDYEYDLLAELRERVEANEE